MSSFETRLWAELARDHGEALSRASTRRGSNPRRRRSRLVLAGAAALVAAAVAVTLAATVNTPVPAYAIQFNTDGSVTVELNALAGTHALNERLAKLGIRAQIVAPGSNCVIGGSTRALFPRGSLKSDERRRVEAILGVENRVLQALVLSHPQTRSGGLEVRIHPRAIPRDETVILTVRSVRANRSHAIGMSLSLHRGTSPECPTVK